jgi:predicted MFS family arabinose efflux permease
VRRGGQNNQEFRRRRCRSTGTDLSPIEEALKDGPSHQAHGRHPPARGQLERMVTMTMQQGVQQAVEDRAVSYRLSPRTYAWVLFAVSIGLLLSDYMSRQVLNAVFPLLRADWGLSDSQLGTLSGVVAIMVGLLTFPLSLAADRFGRVKSIVAMALIWSLATMACGMATSYGQMVAARVFVGVGEAAYGAVGVAVLLSVFPTRLRATITGTFMAGGVFGSVLGIALGSHVAATLGWRWAFQIMAGIGVVLALVYLAVARPEQDRAPNRQQSADFVFSRATFRRLGAQLFSAPSVVFAYIGSGLQLFVASAFIAWMPSFLNRVYDMPTAKAGSAAAIFIMLGGVGMIVCSMVADRAGQIARTRKISFAIAYCLLSFAAFTSAFLFPAGQVQLILLGVGMFFAAGVGGAAGAVVVNCTDAAIHATALATLTLVNNLIGLAPGPIVTGILADHANLATALQIVPFASLGAVVAFWFCRKHYDRDHARLTGGEK